MIIVESRTHIHRGKFTRERTADCIAKLSGLCVQSQRPGWYVFVYFRWIWDQNEALIVTSRVLRIATHKHQHEERGGQAFHCQKFTLHKLQVYLLCSAQIGVRKQPWLVP